MRKRHTAEFKAKVALEAVKGLKLVNEIASHYEVNPRRYSGACRFFVIVRNIYALLYIGSNFSRLTFEGQ